MDKGISGELEKNLVQVSNSLFLNGFVQIMCQHDELHKSPYKARFIAGATNRTTKHLSKLVARFYLNILKDVAKQFITIQLLIAIREYIAPRNFWRSYGTYNAQVYVFFYFVYQP